MTVRVLFLCLQALAEDLAADSLDEAEDSLLPEGAGSRAANGSRAAAAAKPLEVTQLSISGDGEMAEAAEGAAAPGGSAEAPGDSAEDAGEAASARSGIEAAAEMGATEAAEPAADGSEAADVQAAPGAPFATGQNASSAVVFTPEDEEELLGDSEAAAEAVDSAAKVAGPQSAPVQQLPQPHGKRRAKGKRG